MEEQSVCEEKVFRALFDAHAETIRNFLYYKCKNLEQAEDLTQDAFIKLWKNCQKVLVEKAKSFVMKVAQNALYNEIAHDKVILNYAKQKSGSINSGERPDFVLEEKEFLVKLQRSISGLTPKEREVFLLSRKDKKTYKEIAEIVGITQKGVERRMHMALLKLREQIGRSI